MQHVNTRSRLAVLALAGTAAVGLSLASTPLAAQAASGPQSMTSDVVRPVPASAGHISTLAVPSPLPTSQCLAQLARACYSPLQLRTAYGLNAQYAQGTTGKGRTVCVVDALGSPTAQHDLDVFDAQWGLPGTTVRIVYPAGAVPPFDPNSPDSQGWAGETSLDLQAVHAFAPGAKIVLAVTPVSETEGVTGFPEIMKAEKYLVDHGMCDVISQSFGASEPTFPGFAQGNYSSLLDLRYAFKDAVRHDVTLVAGAGDTGSAAVNADGTGLLPDPALIWPGSDPDVTSAGGTQLYLDDAGSRVGADTVWNDAWGSTGGGLSQVFSRPAYQNSVASVVGSHRGAPDLSFSSAVNGGMWAYISYSPDSAGWHVFGGTSFASPQVAAMTALADQKAGHRLGNINRALYEMAAHQGYGARTGLVDITSGSNVLDGSGVPGYSATTGYDLASGLGTADEGQLVDALARR